MMVTNDNDDAAAADDYYNDDDNDVDNGNSEALTRGLRRVCGKPINTIVLRHSLGNQIC